MKKTLNILGRWTIGKDIQQAWKWILKKDYPSPQLKSKYLNIDEGIERCQR